MGVVLILTTYNYLSAIPKKALYKLPTFILQNTASHLKFMHMRHFREIVHLTRCGAGSWFWCTIDQSIDPSM